MNVRNACVFIICVILNDDKRNFFKIWPIRAKDFSFVMVENYKALRTERSE